MATLVKIFQDVLASKGANLPAETKRILLKEAAQAYVLDFIYNHPVYRRLNFYGGTCLHVVYELNRLSEDLDFDNSAGVDVSPLAGDIEGYFKSMFAYENVDVKLQRGGSGISRCTIKLPVLNELGLSGYANETLHLKVEVSHHQQVCIIQNTPSFYYGRSFVPAHFSLETMMAGKMIACLERNFQRGREGPFVKGRDFYDLLWFMQKGVRPLEEKLARDGGESYTIRSAMRLLTEKVRNIKPSDLAVDLLPLFESRGFIDAWLDSFHVNFERYVSNYFSE